MYDSIAGERICVALLFSVFLFLVSREKQQKMRHEPIIAVPCAPASWSKGDSVGGTGKPAGIKIECMNPVFLPVARSYNRRIEVELPSSVGLAS